MATPAHVPDALVYDVDIYALPGAETDITAAYLEIQRAFPPIFWTPRNGGHWVMTHGEDVVGVERAPAVAVGDGVALEEDAALRAEGGDWL